MKSVWNPREEHRHQGKPIPPATEESPTSYSPAPSPEQLPSIKFHEDYRYYLGWSRRIWNLALLTLPLDLLVASVLGGSVGSRLYSQQLLNLGVVLVIVSLIGVWNGSLLRTCTNIINYFRSAKNQQRFSVGSAAFVILVIAIELITKLSALGLKAVIFSIIMIILAALSTYRTFKKERARMTANLALSSSRTGHHNYLLFLIWLIPVILARLGSLINALLTPTLTWSDVGAVIAVTVVAALIISVQAPSSSNYLSRCRGCSKPIGTLDLNFELCELCQPSAYLRSINGRKIRDAKENKEKEEALTK